MAYAAGNSKRVRQAIARVAKELLKKATVDTTMKSSDLETKLPDGALVISPTIQWMVNDKNESVLVDLKELLGDKEEQKPEEVKQEQEETLDDIIDKVTGKP